MNICLGGPLMAVLHHMKDEKEEANGEVCMLSWEGERSQWTKAMEAPSSNGLTSPHSLESLCGQQMFPRVLSMGKGLDSRKDSPVDR